MKIKDGFILREVSNTCIAVAVGDRVKEFNGMINLNPTGAFIWKQLEKDCTKQQIVEALVKEYEIDTQIAEEHTDKFINLLKNANLLV